MKNKFAEGYIDDDEYKLLNLVSEELEERGCETGIRQSRPQGRNPEINSKGDIGAVEVLYGNGKRFGINLSRGEGKYKAKLGFVDPERDYSLDEQIELIELVSESLEDIPEDINL